MGFFSDCFDGFCDFVSDAWNGVKDFFGWNSEPNNPNVNYNSDCDSDVYGRTSAEDPETVKLRKLNARAELIQNFHDDNKKAMKNRERQAAKAFSGVFEENVGIISKAFKNHALEAVFKRKVESFSEKGLCVVNEKIRTGDARMSELFNADYDSADDFVDKLREYCQEVFDEADEALVEHQKKCSLEMCDEIKNFTSKCLDNELASINEMKDTAEKIVQGGEEMVNELKAFSCKYAVLSVAHYCSVCND